MVADVRDPDSVEAMMGVTVERFGTLHIAVNNAGIGGPPGVSAAEYPIDAWRQLMSVNFDGVFYCIRAEIPRLLAAGGGSIVHLASVYGAVGSGLGIAYVAAKHGVVGLTRGMALEYAPAKIRVNAVGPGFIRTPMVEPYLDEAMIAQLNALHPAWLHGHRPRGRRTGRLAGQRRGIIRHRRVLPDRRRLSSPIGSCSRTATDQARLLQTTRRSIQLTRITVIQPAF